MGDHLENFNQINVLLSLFIFLLFLQNNNITEINKNTFCKSNDTYYLRRGLAEVRLDGNPVVLSKYPDSFICMKVLPVGKYRWRGRDYTVIPLLLSAEGYMTV